MKLHSATAAALLLAGQALAAPLTVQETFGTFGAVTQGFTGNSESEGRVFIQGDVTGTVIVNDRELARNADGYDDLIITGNATGATLKVGNDGDLTIGGNMTDTNLELNGKDGQVATLGGTRSGGNFNVNQDVLIENAATLNMPEVDFVAYAAESFRLSQLAGQDVDASDRNRIVFGGAPVLNVSLADLAGGTAFLDLGTLDALVINVSGTSGRFGLNFGDFDGIPKLAAATKVVWNFFEATALELGSSLFGHILAPLAEITVNSSNEGSVIARSLIVNNGELHPLAFDGNLPQDDAGPVPAPVPLPAGMALMLTGLAGIAALRRRKP